jgi:hypothetical protein
MTLLPFNSYMLSSESAIRCPMCFYPHSTLGLQNCVGTAYCEDIHLDSDLKSSYRGHGDKPEPHLHRTCIKCSYEWLERTGDYKVPGAYTREVSADELK